MRKMKHNWAEAQLNLSKSTGFLSTKGHSFDLWACYEFEVHRVTLFSQMKLNEALNVWHNLLPDGKLSSDDPCDAPAPRCS